MTADHLEELFEELYETIRNQKSQLSLALEVLADLGFDPHDFADAT